jgi:hypothetical protein
MTSICVCNSCSDTGLVFDIGELETVECESYASREHFVRSILTRIFTKDAVTAFRRRVHFRTLLSLAGPPKCGPCDLEDFPYLISSNFFPKLVAGTNQIVGNMSEFL